jgi:ABC-2 type transport system permease protein
MVAYRSATVAGILTNFFWGLLRAYIFVEVYRVSGATAIRGYTLRDAITYAALTQALIAPIYLWGWFDVARTVRSGEIASDLTKPYDFFAFWMARDMGRALFQLLFRGLPILVFFPLLFDLEWPRDPVHFLAIAASVTLAVMISFAWRFGVNLAAFWLTDALGVARLAYLVMTFLSGFLVPVAFFPDWLRAVAELTPLPAMVNTPVEVYLGVVVGPDLWRALAIQALWFAALAAAVRAAFRAGVARLVIQGG